MSRGLVSVFAGPAPASALLINFPVVPELCLNGSGPRQPQADLAAAACAQPCLLFVNVRCILAVFDSRQTRGRLAANAKLGDAAAAARVSQVEHAFFNRLFEDVVNINFEFERAARALLRIQGRRHSKLGWFSRLMAALCGIRVPDQSPGLKPSAKVRYAGLESGPGRGASVL